MLGSRLVKIGTFHFVAGRRKRRLNQGFVVLCYVLAVASFFCVYLFVFQMHMCYSVYLFRLSVQSITWEGLSPK